MKLLRLSFAAVLALGFGTAYAFHSGGVAECGGCHSMHSPAAGGSFLLVGTDQSSACLTCHQHAGDTGPSSYHISTAPADMPAGTAPLQRTPGGDFGWVKKTYTGVIRNEPFTELGETHGHNIIANDFGYVVDSVNATAPGGTFPAAQLACNSCHDPHGKFRRGAGDVVTRGGAAIKTSGSYNGAANEPGTIGSETYTVGVYRLLAGNGYTKGGVTFPGVPPAKVKSGYNSTEATTQVRVAYGQVAPAGNATWSDWCATCHPNMHSAGNYVHPTDQALGSTIAANYNAYVKTGDMSGNFTSNPNKGPFTSLVPFATDGSGNTYANLNTVSNSLAGPTSTDRVTCMSCHRAHASGWEYMLRWNMEGELLTWDGAYPTIAGKPQFARGRTQQEIAAAYYDRPASDFSAYQRVLCNKCHAQD